jgi:hypothetical protein
MGVSAHTSEGSILIFNATTHRQNSDDTCVILPGEHPYITHKSVIAYERGRLLPKSAYDYALSLAAIRPMVKISPELLLRIQEGALSSPFTASKFKELVRATLGR